MFLNMEMIHLARRLLRWVMQMYNLESVTENITILYLVEKNLLNSGLDYRKLCLQSHPSLPMSQDPNSNFAVE